MKAYKYSLLGVRWSSVQVEYLPRNTRTVDRPGHPLLRLACLHCTLRKGPWLRSQNLCSGSSENKAGQTLFIALGWFEKRTRYRERRGRKPRSWLLDLTSPPLTLPATPIPAMTTAAQTTGNPNLYAAPSPVATTADSVLTPEQGRSGPQVHFPRFSAIRSHTLTIWRSRGSRWTLQTRVSQAP